MSKNQTNSGFIKGMPLYVVHTDGACRGNPGPMGIGGVIEIQENGEKSQIIRKFSKPIGDGTNNEAEYTFVFKKHFVY